MKKLFTSFLAAGTVASFAACAKKEAKPAAKKTEKKSEKKSETKTTAVVKGKLAKGTFKIGVLGTDLAVEKTGKELATVVAKYSQDIKEPSGSNKNPSGVTSLNFKGTGDEFFKLPSGLFLKTSFDNWMEESGDANGDGTITAPGEVVTKPIQLTDKTKMASSKLDALFVAVKDGTENNSGVYKAVVEKKQFGTTKLFFIGEKAKSQEGASSKVFAGGNVSTASFNKYAAAYVAGFQAAVGAIKFSGSEDVYEETTVSFLIGATSESTDKKKAFAFRRGVEAAVAHPTYSKYLKVKFVSKVEDPSKASKKLYREISEWKATDDSKSKLYHFSSSDTFSDADRRVVYIAGSTAKDWVGEIKKTDPGADMTNEFFKGDDYGLVGALYNYKEAGDSATEADDLTTKTFSRGVWVVLDEASKATLSADTDTTSADAKTSLIARYSGSGNDADLEFERHQVKFYGALGQESSGTSSYAEAALKGAYMGGPSYMIGKHTIFGAKLDISNVTGTKWSAETGDKLEPWRKSTGSNDSDSKAKDRFNVSFAKATEKKLTEAELTKSSPWLK